MCGEYTTEIAPEEFTPEPEIVLKVDKVISLKKKHWRPNGASVLIVCEGMSHIFPLKSVKEWYCPLHI